jgi:hypothetical protein
MGRGTQNEGENEGKRRRIAVIFIQSKSNQSGANNELETLG